jgi:glycosyltransferase involved in cell wall biosynthesis
MDFLATSGRRSIFDDEAERLGARIYYVRYGRSSLHRFAGQFRRILRERQYDAIHDHQDYVSGWHFMMADRALPQVRVTHVHNPAYQIVENYGVTPVRRLTARIGKALVRRYATHITGTSRQVITEYGFDAPSFQRIPKAALHCGFDAGRFVGDRRAARAALCAEFGWPADAKIMLVAGRIDQSPDARHPQTHKNSAFAVSVGIECARRDASVRMLFAGQPSPAVPVLEARIADAGFGGGIRFAGLRGDIERLMSASDVLLFPSRGEGLGMVAVEAQAAGLPILASTAVPRECVVVPELTRFQTLDAGEAAWAADLLQLAALPRDTATANRRVAASAFSIEHSARALHNLYCNASLA